LKEFSPWELLLYPLLPFFIPLLIIVVVVRGIWAIYQIVNVYGYLRDCHVEYNYRIYKVLNVTVGGILTLEDSMTGELIYRVPQSAVTMAGNRRMIEFELEKERRERERISDDWLLQE